MLHFVGNQNRLLCMIFIFLSHCSHLFNVHWYCMVFVNMHPSPFPLLRYLFLAKPGFVALSNVSASRNDPCREETNQDHAAHAVHRT